MESLAAWAEEHQENQTRRSQTVFENGSAGESAALPSDLHPRELIWITVFQCHADQI